ncbi:hypothetical protein H0H92_001550 [Tricholoma furcatifolium]|nr:hypothetical protein H0H92_001550 [Tricholoma furcatifolium]
MAEAVQPLTEDKKEAAKEWIENHSCKAWRDGWCLVDGTLVPLYYHPFWYGQSYFDHILSMYKFFKGHFQSLKELCVNIKDEASHKFAMYWVCACIGIHAFAMQCEDEEQGSDAGSDSVLDDPFVIGGLSSSSESDTNATPSVNRDFCGHPRLRTGKK